MSSKAFDPPTMLSDEERMLLHWAARTRRVSGVIVDAGCFLGGSTVPLALGARQSGRQTTIHSFDLFRVGSEREQIYFEPLFPFAVGASTLGLFEENIAAVRDNVVIHQGDINEISGWSEDVAVLFIDITKSWETNDAVVSNFFPRLVPGSLVIQQDLVHCGHPWCAMTMELLGDKFEFLGHVPYSSAVYRTVAPIAPEELPLRLPEHVSADEAFELIQRAAERVGEPSAGYVRLAGAMAFALYGRLGRARRIVDDVARAYSAETLPWMVEQLELAKFFIAGHAWKEYRTLAAQ